MDRLSEPDLEEGTVGTELEDLIDSDAPATGTSKLFDPWPTSGENSKPAEEHIDQNGRSTVFLSGLRGLAAFLVYMAHHVPWWYGVGKLDTGFGYHGEKYFATLPFVRSFFSGGSAAVAIFFVLSGYVLSIGPLRLLNRGRYAQCYRSLVSAFVRRPLRLFIPPVGISLAFALLMHLPFGLAPHLEWPEPEATLMKELRLWLSEVWFMINIFEKHGIFTRWFRYDPPVWTMAVEYSGSLLVFAAIPLFSLAPPKYIIYLFAITGLVLFASYHWAMACFMAGATMALNDLETIDVAFTAKLLTERRKNIAYNFIFVLGWWMLSTPAGTKDPERAYNTPGWYYLTMAIPRNYFNDEYFRFWNVIGATLVVFGVLRISWLKAFLSQPALLYLGKISFSFYLVHLPFEWTVGDRIYRIFGKSRQDFTTPFDGLLSIPDIGPLDLTTGFVVSQIFILPGTLLLAEIGTKLLDEPSVRVGKIVVARMGLNKNGHL